MKNRRSRSRHNGRKLDSVSNVCSGCFEGIVDVNYCLHLKRNGLCPLTSGTYRPDERKERRPLYSI